MQIAVSSVSAFLAPNRGGGREKPGFPHLGFADYVTPTRGLPGFPGNHRFRVLLAFPRHEQRRKGEI
ncbi:hypothetical protein Taro_007213 [Colocasia esculenta]|uniref:Uncharacterized protein n=1 Tax=Colocasia esculenta TaxID=4460 RepID=A0A843TZQ6_COLES|nr:hypothetical protein [Colocasia esculenta]